MTSYGYDCLLGYVFDVFKPYPAVCIDPLNFDKRMLERVDLTPHDGWHELCSDPNSAHCGECIHCHVGAEHTTDKPCSKRPPTPNHLLIPPHSFVLAETIETFNIPRDILVVVVGKSTLARCGLIVNVTPGEPEWPGKWTIELSNTTPLPMKVYPGMGIMQCLFLRSDEWRDHLHDRMELLCHKLSKVPPGAGGIIGIGHVNELARVGRDLYEELREVRKKANCERSYLNKTGKYSGQTGLTHPIADPNKEGN